MSVCIQSLKYFKCKLACFFWTRSTAYQKWSFFIVVAHFLDSLERAFNVWLRTNFKWLLFEWWQCIQIYSNENCRTLLQKFLCFIRIFFTILYKMVQDISYICPIYCRHCIWSEIWTLYVLDDPIISPNYLMNNSTNYKGDFKDCILNLLHKAGKQGEKHWFAWNNS